MDDFYIYYELQEQSHTIGTIKAIAPLELTEMDDMEFIRVSSEVGLSFTRGSESLTRWVIKWLPEFAEMRLFKQEQVGSERTIDFMKIIPTLQRDPQVIVTWQSERKIFNITTQGISPSHPDMDMHFFVTRKDDPNIYYDHFSVALSDTMKNKGTEYHCHEMFPEKFSVSTRSVFERYQFRIDNENF